MTTPNLNDARVAVLQINSQFALPPAAKALLDTISGYLESVPAATVESEKLIAMLRAQIAFDRRYNQSSNEVCAYQHMASA